MSLAQTMQGQGKEEGWEDTVPFNPGMLEQADWESLNSLAYVYGGDTLEAPAPQEPPLQLAAGGISFQSQRAINELDTDGRPAQREAVKAWTPGQDDPISSGVKGRLQQQKREEGIKLFMQRGMTRDQAERVVKG